MREREAEREAEAEAGTGRQQDRQRQQERVCETETGGTHLVALPVEEIGLLVEDEGAHKTPYRPHVERIIVPMSTHSLTASEVNTHPVSNQQLWALERASGHTDIVLCAREVELC